MEKQLKVATKRLIDSVWTLEYYDLGEDKIEIVSHSRVNQKGYDLEMSVDQFRLIEDNNRTVIGVKFAKPDYFKFEPYKTVTVFNPENIFGYPDSKTEPEKRTIRYIAREINRLWTINANHPVNPYLEAMMTLDTIDQKYGEDSASMIVAYFLCNATGWRGADARRIKKELNELLKSKK